LESCDSKNLLQYLIKEQNGTLRDSTTSIKEELKEERKAFRKTIEANQIKFHKDLITEVKTEIERSLKRSELETQRMNRELLVQKLINVLNKSSTEVNGSRADYG
jgi:hypothetical protein